MVPGEGSGGGPGGTIVCAGVAAASGGQFSDVLVAVTTP